MADMSTSDGAAQRITEALARKVMAAVEASQREIEAPSYPTDAERVAWADGYTKACEDIRAAMAGARICCNPDCHREGTVYVGDLTTLGDYACSLCEVYIVGDGNDD